MSNFQFSREVAASSDKNYFYLLIGLMTFEYVRPQDSIIPALSALKIPMFLAIILIIFTIKSIRSGDYLNIPALRYFLAFLVFMASGVLFAVNTFWPFQNTVDLALVLFSMMFPMVILISTLERLKLYFFWISLLSVYVAFYAITHGGWGPGGVIFDENDTALAMCTLIPFSYYLAQVEGISKKTKTYYLFAVFIGVLSIAYTSSRGGFVGLVAVVMGFWFYSKRKMRMLFIGGLVGIALSGAVLTLLPDGYVDDMSSISDTKNSTRKERFYSWGLAVDIFYDNPFIGVGVGNYPFVVGKYERLLDVRPAGQPSVAGRAAHSNFFTLISELGLLGLILYWTMVAKSFSACKTKSIEKLLGSNNIIVLLMTATKVGILGFLACSIFISVTYYPQIFILMAYSIVLKNISDKEIEKLRVVD